MTSIRFATMAVMLAGVSVKADTEIHRCLLEDGTVAFQETPCPDPAIDADDPGKAEEDRGAGETPAQDDGAIDFTSPFDVPAEPMTPSGPEAPALVSQDRAECEKTTRDAIDAIDAELQKNAYSKEQGEEYLAELLTLTEQLRACKRL